ncbi:MAG TPA: RNA polymerase sigma factor SigZ [Ktedonobacteraceae bacterium]|jgi:RNA polymerase sigma-70 factor (ECF subfamily)
MKVSTEHVWYALHEPIRSFIDKRIADKESVEDLLQEVFLKVHMHIGTLRDEAKLESWIYQVTRNLIADYYRQKPRFAPLEEAELFLLPEEMPEKDIHAELAPSITAMVNSLPSAYREALFLTDYQGLSQKDLAILLGLSFSGAKSRVQRARGKLKQLLLDCCDFELDRFGQIIDYQPRCGCTQEACVPNQCCL